MICPDCGHDNIAGVDIFMAVAAVADYQPEKMRPNKIKKSESHMSIELVKAPDTLSAISALPERPFCVGFAAETENHIAFGMEKLRSKNLDLVVVNDVGGPNSAFNSDTNQISILDAGGAEENLPRMSMPSDFLILWTFPE